MDDILVEREERGPVSVLTMVYRPYNLLAQGDKGEHKLIWSR
jgi:hypothetical protein